jgi:catechol 2,3-dioxygenase-like lactoylglutathione lyase family enzyme
VKRARFLILIAFVACGLVRAAPAPTTAPTVTAVVRVGFTVSDLDRSVEFLHRVLDFQKDAEVERAGPAFEAESGIFGARARVAMLHLGEEKLELTEYLTPGGRDVPRDSRSNDHWFQHVAIITSDMERAYERLRQTKVKYASSEPQRIPDWNPAAGGVRAFYFRDPDNHVLEILRFPPGKGEARWHATDRLFLGIDHTAIVVSDTGRSLAFYRDQLGLKVVGTSENWGDEQEHLNNVRGAHLRITTLRGASGPGVEFLEYISPRDGREYPADARADDLFHWQTTLKTAHGDERSLRDPDGHAVTFAK